MSTESKRLTKEMTVTLRHLRREVDDLQDEVMRTTREQMDAKGRLFRAQERLREFTDDLRKQGFLI